MAQWRSPPQRVSRPIGTRRQGNGYTYKDLDAVEATAAERSWLTLDGSKDGLGIAGETLMSL